MKIGFIGLGLMGEAMSRNLVAKSGHTVQVFDVDRAKVDHLVAHGAEAAGSVREVGAACDVVFSMVPKSEHVEAVYADLLTVARAGQVLVDISTIAPDVSAALAARVAATGAVMLDAPVVKSRPAAIAGTLGFYVGGDAGAFAQVRPLLECMGSKIIHLGANGTGLVMKLCHNVLVAEIQNGVNEILTVAQHFGIPLDSFAEAVSYGGATNFYLTSKLDTLRREDFTPAFSAENMHKDIGYFRQMTGPAGLKLPGVEAAAAVYAHAMATGLGGQDFSVTRKAVEDMSRG
ncbi:NAD(P)-dependent oxidoreductase [Rhodovastum atsumiense]|uniref:NAD(P)-dependent oxidoreductase n=1 Tax=Rhodovastum atsumiense TaxID=504468 RepID=A0A5M6INP0_9PROT|nr:NAD(P)-dependent oxidoreductase [Rhodovastum atsumiense]KAA5609085.1 NAD(P)-dependent oxidoreductase [Rhodovastum atsumiense]CAH2602161.1 NAD(P)-dependent oxidoreductase [Rhodovastum atsumiense]